MTDELGEDTVAASEEADTLVSGGGDDTISASTGADAVTSDHIASLGLDPEKVSSDDPAITGVPRDEIQDSIDPHTGTLTEEALERRRAASE